MEKLITSHWSDFQCVPEDYIFPPESRPGNIKIPFNTSIPVIDLSEAQNGDRTNTIHKIIKASEEFGFFQVINHGVSVNRIKETMNVFNEVFKMPDVYKKKLITNDPSKPCKMFTSSINYDHEKVHLWKDTLRHKCYPLEQSQHLWPENPTNYRECVGDFSTEVKKLGSRIMNLIGEGLGLENGYFDNDLTGSILLSVNHYPPCPEPSLTLGIIKHSDPNLITILLQDDVSGLQVFKHEEWIAVEAIPHAFVINVGYQLQIISNGKLKSVEHRAVTNSSHGRTSAAFCLAPSGDCNVGPAQAITDENNPPIFKNFKYKEFISHYINKNGDTDVVLKSFETPR
ncbi:flavanone 3-dioxygenase 2-like [Vicia villosa]|uniref:flavanone 3-dioxygenase 2-like n=1 Tax=Vicia villosa TaxID=3911 RepID=UPI00273B58FC|nr:flavanone 3-dioxygenase 2-like [Vicia villosa]